MHITYGGGITTCKDNHNIQKWNQKKKKNTWRRVFNDKNNKLHLRIVDIDRCNQVTDTFVQLTITTHSIFDRTSTIKVSDIELGKIGEIN